MAYIPQRGDLVWLDFSPQAGREQAGRRPALVVSSGTYNRTGLMFACPITSKVKNYPFEVKIEEKTIVGAVLADHLKNQDWRARNAKFIAKAHKVVIQEVMQIISAILTK